MPVYVYAHKRKGRCQLGAEFEIVQPVSDEALTRCPECGRAVYRVILPPMAVRSPYGNSDLKGMGFTKLVRRDKGVYENVTATDGESRVVEAGKPHTLPHLRKKIRD
jgi:predicted nucleic acid-binding Zn ribbon protein